MPDARHAEPTLRQLYQQMRLPDLVCLQEAFILDARTTDSPLCRAFCEERLRLVRQVIKAKAGLQQAREARARERALHIPEE